MDLSKASRASALRASLTGWRARLAGDGPGDCPWDANGDRTERFLAGYWLRGYRMAGGSTPGAEGDTSTS